MKKTLLLLVLFSGILGCECWYPDEHWKIDELNITIHDSFGLPIDGIIQGDSVSINLTPEISYLSSVHNPFNGLMGSVYATSCADPGQGGLKDKLASFSLISSADFNGITAGQPLNDLLKSFENETTLAEFLFRWNTEAFTFWNGGFFIFTARPAVGSTHRFTLQLVFESGEIIERSTEEIRWN